MVTQRLPFTLHPNLVALPGAAVTAAQPRENETDFGLLVTKQ